MSDIFHEVDEEVRREKLKQLWERHSNLIVAAALLVVLAVGGWRGYEWWETKKAAESGAAFEAAVTLAESGKQAEAQAAFAKLAKEGSLRLPHARRASARPPSSPRPIRPAAVKAYDALAADSSLGRPLQDLAADPRRADPGRYRAARRTDRAARAADRGRTVRSATPRANCSRSAPGAPAITAAAKRWFDLIATDAETPAGTRQRMEVLMTLDRRPRRRHEGSAMRRFSPPPLSPSASRLRGCESFDPLDKFPNSTSWARRRSRCRASAAPCFDSGVPGVPQGVPPEMVKGYQPPAEAPPPVIEAKPESKPKAEEERLQPRRASSRSRPAAAGSSSRCSRRRPRSTTTQPVSQSAGRLQTMPGAQPTWPTNAPPAPARGRRSANPREAQI